MSDPEAKRMKPNPIDEDMNVDVNTNGQLMACSMDVEVAATYVNATDADAHAHAGAAAAAIVTEMQDPLSTEHIPVQVPMSVQVPDPVSMGVPVAVAGAEVGSVTGTGISAPLLNVNDPMQGLEQVQSQGQGQVPNPVTASLPQGEVIGAEAEAVQIPDPVSMQVPDPVQAPIPVPHVDQNVAALSVSATLGDPIQVSVGDPMKVAPSVGDVGEHIQVQVAIPGVHVDDNMGIGATVDTLGSSFDADAEEIAAAAVAEVEAAVAQVQEDQQQQQQQHHQQQQLFANQESGQVQGQAEIAQQQIDFQIQQAQAQAHAQANVVTVVPTHNANANENTNLSTNSPASAAPMPPLPLMSAPHMQGQMLMEMQGQMNNPMQVQVQHPHAIQPNPVQVSMPMHTQQGLASGPTLSPPMNINMDTSTRPEPVQVQPRGKVMGSTKGAAINGRPSMGLAAADPAYRRKDKSLGVLCANFMRRYSKIKTELPNTTPEVTIDEASQSLMVERRRIYDIINILEAIEVVTRKGKNTYHWHGMTNITHTLRKMQKEGFELFPDDVAANQLKKEETKPSIPTGFAMLLASAEQVDQTVKKGKEKSLGRLSQKFIQLFLVGNETITLEAASDKILGKTELPQPSPDATAEEMQKIRNSNNKMIKTKIRRLYDIANIMASVGLIAKLHSENQHVGSAPRSRPMFKWIYPLSATEILNSVDDVGAEATGAPNEILQAGASGSNIRVEINPMTHTSTISVHVQAGADGGTVTKQVRIGPNGVIENTIPVHDTGASISTRSGTPTPANSNNVAASSTVVSATVTAAATAAAAAANSVEIANASMNANMSISASMAATATAVVNAVDEQLNADADAALAAAEDAAMIANAVVNGEALGAPAVEGHVHVSAATTQGIAANLDTTLTQQPMMDNVDQVAAAAAAAAVNAGEDVAASAAAVAATEEHTVAI